MQKVRSSVFPAAAESARMPVIKSFRDLDAWRVSIDLAVLAYAVAKQPLNYVSPESTREADEQLARTRQVIHGLARSIREKRDATTTVWLALLAALGLGRLVLPVLAEFCLVVGCNDILTWPLAAFDFVLSGIHVDVLAHLNSSSAAR